jgi:flagellar motor switch protein FliM
MQTARQHDPIYTRPQPRLKADALKRLSLFLETRLQASLMNALDAKIAVRLHDYEHTTQRLALSFAMAAPICVTFACAANKTGYMIWPDDMVQNFVDIRMGGDAEDLPDFSGRTISAVDEALCDGFSRSFVADIVTKRARSGKVRREGLDLSYGHLVTDWSRVEAFDDAPLLLMEFAIEIGQARHAQMTIVLPHDALDDIAPGLGMGEGPQQAFERASQTNSMPVPLRAVLARTTYRAQFIEALRVGSVLPLSREVLQTIKIERDSPLADPQTIATAKLASFERRKILKLNDTPCPKTLHTLG